MLPERQNRRKGAQGVSVLCTQFVAALWAEMCVGYARRLQMPRQTTTINMLPRPL